MIIDFRHKYIFVGLPHSGSSAISKELLEMYGAEPLLHKHANIPILLQERPDINLDEFFVFGVVRDPIEIVFSVYNKLLTNHGSFYTDPNCFIENGGFVLKRTRKLYNLIHRKQLSFEGYVRMKYRYLPYDNDLSINAPYLTQVIRFENIADDFDRCLRHIGITPLRRLPVFNKTDKISHARALPAALLKRVFGPFYASNGRYFPLQPEVGPMAKLFFAACQKLRYWKRFWYDQKQKKSTKWLDKLKTK